MEVRRYASHSTKLTSRLSPPIKRKNGSIDLPHKSTALETTPYLKSTSNNARLLSHNRRHKRICELNSRIIEIEQQLNTIDTSAETVSSDNGNDSDIYFDAPSEFITNLRKELEHHYTALITVIKKGLSQDPQKPRNENYQLDVHASKELVKELTVTTLSVVALSLTLSSTGACIPLLPLISSGLLFCSQRGLESLTSYLLDPETSQKANQYIRYAIPCIMFATTLSGGVSNGIRYLGSIIGHKIASAKRVDTQLKKWVGTGHQKDVADVLLRTLGTVIGFYSGNAISGMLNPQQTVACLPINPPTPPSETSHLHAPIEPKSYYLGKIIESLHTAKETPLQPLPLSPPPLSMTQYKKNLTETLTAIVKQSSSSIDTSSILTSFPSIKNLPNSAKEQLRKIMDKMQTDASQILTPEGKYHLTIYTRIAGGYGDIFHPLTLMKALSEDIPNIELHWVVTIDESLYDRQIVQTFFDQANVESATLHCFSRRELESKKVLKNYPKSFSIISPTELRAQHLPSLPPDVKDAIYLHEIGLYKPTNRDGIHLVYGFCPNRGLGLSVTEIDTTTIPPIERCTGSHLLPQNLDYFFGYFLKSASQSHYDDWYVFIQDIINSGIAPQTPTFVLNWNHPHVQLYIERWKEEYELTPDWTEMDVGTIEFFKKEPDGKFQQYTIPFNPQSTRKIRIINPFPIEHREFLSYIKHSNRVVGCTGDNSVAEIVALQKIPYYQHYSYTKNTSLKNLSQFTRYDAVKSYLDQLEKKGNKIEFIRAFQHIDGDIFDLDKIPNANHILGLTLKLAILSQSTAPSYT